MRIETVANLFQSSENYLPDFDAEFHVSSIQTSYEPNNSFKV